MRDWKQPARRQNSLRDLIKGAGQVWFALVREVGAAPFFIAACFLILLRVASPDAVRRAIARMYGDFAPLFQAYLRAKADARDAEPSRDRTIETHWPEHLVAHAPNSPTARGDRAGGRTQPRQAAGMGPTAPSLEEGMQAVAGCDDRVPPRGAGDGGA